MPVIPDRQIAGLAVSAGFPADTIPTVVAIALAESGGNSDAANTSNTNGSRDDGLMQINSIHKIPVAELRDPAKNMAAAFRIWQAAGRKFTPWSVFNNGRYRTFLPRGGLAAGAPDTAGSPVTIPVDNNGGGVNPFAMLTDPGTWLRLGMFVLGAFLLLVALARLTGIGNQAVRIVSSKVPGL